MTLLLSRESHFYVTPYFKTPAKMRKSIKYIFFVYLLRVHCLGKAAEQKESYVSSLQPGSVITPNQAIALLSPNGTFAAGFLSIGHQIFGLGVWYAKIPVPTVVWVANRDHPVDQNSSLLFGNDGNLTLSDSNRRVVWTPNISNPSGPIREIALLESGNLVLKGSNGVAIWQSFDYPTDTLLPQQTFKSEIPLVSISNRRNKITDYSSGDYTLSFNRDNRLSLSYNGLQGASQEYWVDLDSLDTTEYVITGGGVGLIIASAGINKTGGILISDGLSFMTSDFGEGYLRRLTLDADGNLRVYSWHEPSSKWIVVWRAIHQLCKIYGTCGPNAICVDQIVADTQECICPLGFHIHNSSDALDGCDRDIPLECSTPLKSSVSTKFINLDFTDFQGGDLLRLSSQTQRACESACVNNCSCVGFLYKYDAYSWKALGSENCYLKRALSNGYRAPNSESLAFIKVSANSSGIFNGKGIQNSLNVVCPSDIRLNFPKIRYSSVEVTRAVTASSAVLIVELVIGAVAAYIFMSRYSKLREAQRYGMEILSGRPKKFTYAELEAATENFSEQLGKGSYGTVYKGFLPDRKSIAVKKIEQVAQAEDEFWAEVTIICRIHHLNLVRMWGFCAEGDHRLLVYEYISNGSLDKYLFSNHSVKLDWSKRYQIAVGTAKGIAYLHEECLEWILHCDIKPQNILVDEKFCPKVSDFGLAKLVDKESALSVSRIRGTRGYLAPEWTDYNPITAKADVYSFGMVLLELVSGRKNFEFSVSALETNRWCFPVWAFEMVKARRVRNVVDQKMVGDLSEAQLDQVENVINTAFWCIQIEPQSRPSMGKVIQMLEGTLQVQRPLNPSFFSFLENDTSQNPSIPIFEHNSE